MSISSLPNTLTLTTPNTIPQKDEKKADYQSSWASWRPTLGKIALFSSGLLAGIFIRSHFSSLPTSFTTQGSPSIAPPSAPINAAPPLIDPTTKITSDLFLALMGKNETYLNTNNEMTTPVIEAALNPNISLEQFKEIVKRFSAKSEVLDFQDPNKRTALNFLLETKDSQLTSNYENWHRIATLIENGAKGYLIGNSKMHQHTGTKYILEFAYDQKVPATIIKKLLETAQIAFNNKRYTPNEYKHFVTAATNTASNAASAGSTLGLFAKDQKWDIMEVFFDFKEHVKSTFSSPGGRMFFNPIAEMLSNLAEDKLFEKAKGLYDDTQAFCELLSRGKWGIKEALEKFKTNRKASYEKLFEGCK